MTESRTGTVGENRAEGSPSREPTRSAISDCVCRLGG